MTKEYIIYYSVVNKSGKKVLNGFSAKSAEKGNRKGHYEATQQMMS